MSADIIPLLRKRSRSLLERHPGWRAAFVLGALVLLVIVLIIIFAARWATRSRFGLGGD